MDLICKEDCERALRRGIGFLRSSQLASGQFVTLAGPDPDFRDTYDRDPCNFTTMHVATSLLASGSPEGLDVVRRAADFLFAQMLPGGLWRFWTSDHPGSPGMPPDVDDTACVTHLLTGLGYVVPNNRSVLMANRNADGLFYTWIHPRARLASRSHLWPTIADLVTSRRAVSVFFRSGATRPTWDAVDAVVNANALLVCGDDPRANAVVSWFDRLMREGSVARADRFYQGEVPFAYAIARALEAGIDVLKPLAPLISSMLHSLRSAELPPLETAQLVCVSRLLGDDMQAVGRRVTRLLTSQRTDGAWDARAQYYDGFARGRAWGSAELTTGFCVEALGRYLMLAT